MFALATPAAMGSTSEPSGKPDGKKPAQVEAWYWRMPKKHYDTRTLGQLDGFVPSKRTPVSRFGGRTDMEKQEATGFFRTEKIDGRWWLIDPEGYRFFNMAVVSVVKQKGPQFKTAFPKLFGTDSNWARETHALLRTNGFNGTGNWSSPAVSAVEPKLVRTEWFSFCGTFAKTRGNGKQVSGHWGYEHELIPVFDPDFKSYCEEAAQRFAEFREDPYLLGYFTDNELQLPADSLDRHLTLLSAEHPGRKEAERWLKKRRGGEIGTKEPTQAEREDWLGHVMETYYSIVCGAIRKVDPNHLILGTRFCGPQKEQKAVWEVAGKHLDVIAMNLYKVWTPTEDVIRWAQWSGKPLMITEFYARAMDSGLKNRTGAGWKVNTQKDRGLFYQNFTLGLLESRVCVGWHYFRYADNDPTDPKAPPSNRDSNKGIVGAGYKPWTPMLRKMKELNNQVYPLLDWFDAQQ